VPRIFDEEIRAFGDTSNSAFTEEAAEVFLDTIPGGTLIEGGDGND